MNYSPPDMPSIERDPIRRREQFQLTPEEQRVIKECSKEGIFQRAIPTGILFGITGYFVGKSGPLCHSKFGPKPAIVGLGVLGYIVGRFSYSKICFERALAVPDGNLRKIFPHLAEKAGIPVDQAEDYYAPVDASPRTREQIWNDRSQSTDIDIPKINTFDTVPSDYYAEIKEEAVDETPTRPYISHEELRRRNRQEYTNKMYGEGRPMPQRYPEYPQEGPLIRRAPPSSAPQDAQPGIGGGQKTKYGDTWDV